MSAEIHALSGAYAVNAVSEEERADFERHLATCAACRDEVDSLRAAVTLLGESAATPPSPSVRDAVLAGITQIRPLPPIVPETAEDTAAATQSRPDNVVPLRRRWATQLVAAAAVVATLGVGATVWHPWTETTQTVSMADRVLSAPDAKAQTIRLGSAEMTLVRSVALRQAVLTATSMPAPPQGKIYEIWLQNAAGVMVPAGLLPGTASQRFVLAGDAATATGAGITIEPPGGSLHPTSTPVVLFPFKATT